jgi:hypothetical protein
MILQPAKTAAAAPVAPALPRQTDSKVSQELLAVLSYHTYYHTDDFNMRSAFVFSSLSLE